MGDYDDNVHKALRENDRKSATLEWMRQRTQTVKDNISAHDVLRHNGINLKYNGSGHEEQLQCPFHGKDNKPSARVFPDGARSKSHVFCYTCGNGKPWDVFALWKKFKGDDEMKFSLVVFELERAFGIIPPDGPSQTDSVDTGPSDAEREVLSLFEVCERRLLEAKPCFERKGYLQVGQLLDRIRYRFDNRTIPPADASTVLRQVLDKVGEKIRA